MSSTEIKYSSEEITELVDMLSTKRANRSSTTYGCCPLFI